MMNKNSLIVSILEIIDNQLISYKKIYSQEYSIYSKKSNNFNTKKLKNFNQDAFSNEKNNELSIENEYNCSTNSPSQYSKQNSYNKEQKDSIIISDQNIKNYEQFYVTTDTQKSQLQKMIECIESSNQFYVPDYLMLQSSKILNQDNDIRNDSTKQYQFQIQNKFVTLQNQVNEQKPIFTKDEKINLYKKQLLSFLIHHKNITEIFLNNIKISLNQFKTGINFQNIFVDVLNESFQKQINFSMIFSKFVKQNEKSNSIQFQIDEMQMNTLICIVPSDIINQKIDQSLLINKKQFCFQLGNMIITLKHNPYIYQYLELNNEKLNYIQDLILKIHNKLQFNMHIEFTKDEEQYEQLFKYRQFIQSDSIFKNYSQNNYILLTINNDQNINFTLQNQLDLNQLEIQCLINKINYEQKNIYDSRILQSEYNIAEQIHQLNQIIPNCVEVSDFNPIIRMKSQVYQDNLYVQSFNDEVKLLIKCEKYNQTPLAGLKAILTHLNILVKQKQINSLEIDNVIKFTEFNLLTKKKKQYE